MSAAPGPPPVILYGWLGDSPFRKKLELVLRLKNIAYDQVEVPIIPPRTALQLLGITYRKVPVLAIGNDIYFDTYLASLALDESFPHHQLFPPATAGIQRALSFFWAERTIMNSAGPILDWSGATEDMLKDRAAFGFGSGATIDPLKIIRGRTTALSTLRTQMALIEMQLGARKSPFHYLLDTPLPTFVDVSIYTVLSWFSRMPAAAHLFDKKSSKHPNIVAWMSLFWSNIESIKKHNPVFLTPEEAAKKILEYPASPPALLRTDKFEPLLLDSIHLGDDVEVTPNDTGKIPQKGSLLAINQEVVVIKVEAKEKGKFVKVFAPRLGFTVKKDGTSSKL